MGRLSPQVLASAALLVALLNGCALTRPIEFEALPRYEAPPLPAIIDVEPAPVVAGDVVPFDGWVVTEPDWQRMKDQSRDLVRALAKAYQEIDRVTWYAQRVDHEKTEALKACLRDKPQTFAAGAATGFAACAAAGWAVEAERE